MSIIRAMDRSLKARLIGATVLVLLAVLVVPELLSGRKTSMAPAEATSGNGPMRTYTIELGSGAAPAVAANPSVARPLRPTDAPLADERPRRPADQPEPREAPRSAPPPATVARVEPPRTVSAPPDTRADARTAAPEAPVKPPATVAATPAQGTWSVQVGAFGSTESARKLVRDLEADGFRAYVSSVERNGKILHRVRVGPESARATADALAGRLKSRGLPVSLVAND
jgi:DedD protein